MTTTRTALTPPGTIIAAFFGYLLSTVTAISTGLVLLGARQQLVDTLRTSDLGSGRPMTEDQLQLQDAATIAQAIAIGVVVLIALIYLWLSFRLKAGRNWARVLLTLITLLQVASLFTTEGDTPPGYASCAVAVLALVLSYLPPSNAYIAEVKRAG